MKIAPIDISHKTFSRKMMGLDTEEVQEFLLSVADEMESLVREKNQLREALREKELNIMEYRERDETLKSTITMATKMADKMREDSEREAKLIISDAEHKAEIIVKDARDSLKKTYEEVSELKRIQVQLESNLRGVLETHRNLLEQSKQGLLARPMSASQKERPPTV